MNKELKVLDKELKNNQMLRLPDTTNKADNSLFRALAMSVFFSHAYHPQIKQQLRLTLVCNLNDRRNNPYPALQQNQILKKYQADPQLLLDYWQHQQLQCFTQDNLMLASAAFGMPICLLYLDKEQYLNETYILGCKNPQDRRIKLAKVGKKFYCVLEQSLHSAFRFLKETFFEELLTAVFEDEQYLLRHEVPPKDRLKLHKKSLSECNELSQQEIFPQEKKERSNQKERNSSRIPSPHKGRQIRISLKQETVPNINLANNSSPAKDKQEHSPSRYEASPSKISDMSPSKVPEYFRLSEYEPGMLDTSYKGYYYHPQSQYHPYMMPQEHYLSSDQPYYLQSTNPVNNQRYTGRLKFFDQSGNYGFIVIDNLNIDLFVHYDDLSKAGLGKEKLMAIKSNYQLRFQFTYYEYEGKQHRKSKKAVDLQLIE